MPDSSVKDPILRKPNGQFQKGCTPNPSGRPKGFKGMAAYIRKKTRSGEELADFAIEVFKNEEATYTHAQRWDAMRWLADRGFGKAVQTQIEISADGEEDNLPDFSDVDPDKLQQLDDMIGALLKAGESDAE